MSIQRIFHGSPSIVKAPTFGLGNPANDYGLGFYCTEDINLALEWAVGKTSHPGFANEYALNNSGLNIIDLDENPHGVLGWMATLMANRKGTYPVTVSKESLSRFISAFAIDLSEADVIEGYRADDSYFDIARSFMLGAIGIESLKESLELGNLGRQTVLISQKAFQQIEFVTAHPAEPAIWHPARSKRNYLANEAFFKQIKTREYGDDIYLADILRELNNG